MGLNKKQKQAVEYLDGPLLVLAGPGTGKTQLLSEKVAYILKNTDTNPENILCLTFTETGARNMRERLMSLIGRDGMRVNIGTYHAFGMEVLGKYKNYTTEYTRQLDNAIDEVTQFRMVQEIRDKLPAQDILRGDNVKNIISIISEAKAAGMNADDLKRVAEQNIADSEVLSQTIAPYLENVVPRVFKASYENAYRPIYEILKDYEMAEMILPRVERSIGQLARDLKDAIVEAESEQKVKPLTAWRDSNFEKDGKGRWRLSDRVANKKLMSVAKVMAEYQAELRHKGLYDYDDMIEEAVRVLKEDTGFRLSLAEKYQYVMLDEFQDTNPSQLSIVKLLTDYDKPLIMAVGDDDQAIYEFQGARSTNLTDFQEHYEAEVVTLTENYRSTQEILDFSHEVVKAAPDRFGDKILTAHKEDLAQSGIERVEFLSSDQEYTYVADKIAELIRAGVPQSEIAVISYKTKYFMPLLTYLKAHKEIKIAYEKRDNLLDDARMHQLITVLRLVHELGTERKPSVSMLEVLAYPFWGLDTLQIVKLVGQARAEHTGVFEYLSSCENEKMREVTEFIAKLIQASLTEPVEWVIYELVQRMKIDSLEDQYEVFRFYENLAALRGRLRRHFGDDKPLRVRDLVQLVDDFEAAEMPMMVVSPYRDGAEAVQILSAHKAKGLEFEHVFIISADHTAWGKGKGNNNMLALPRNLAFIRHTGTTDGEKIRILYVALTRAKSHLYITNSLHDFNGKSPERLEYFEESVAKLPDGTEAVISPFLPSRRVVLDYDGPNQGADDYSGKLKSIEGLKNWLKPYIADSSELTAIYQERVTGWQMNASALTSFIDIVNAGPVEFFRRRILRAENEPETEEMALGNLMHAVFEQVTNQGLTDSEAIDYFNEELEKRDLASPIKEKLCKTGPAELAQALEAFSEVLRSGRAEVDLTSEHLVVDGVPVTGKIDHLSINEDTKEIEIYDFKTGKYHAEKWQSHPTLYKYAMQLMFYKMMLGHSPLYSKYKVVRAHILFVRPDKDSEVYDKAYEFDETAEANLRRLMVAVYKEITTLKFMSDPEIFVPADGARKLADIKEFIALLLAKSEEK